MAAVRSRYENGTVYFANWDDQRIYVQHEGTKPRPLTPEPVVPRGARYADLTITANGKFLLCVRETHSDDGNEAVNEIVAVDTRTGEAKIIASGRDFYCAPRACGGHDGIVWTEWDHPNMPWDGNSLVSGSFDADNATVATTATLAGGQDESVVQPTWSDNGILHFVTDRTGWWNIHAWRDGEMVNLLNEQSDHGRPDWQFGFTSYAHLSDGKIVLGKGGAISGSVVLVDPKTDTTRIIEIPYSEVSFVTRGQNEYHSLCGCISDPRARGCASQPRLRKMRKPFTRRVISASIAATCLRRNTSSFRRRRMNKRTHTTTSRPTAIS